jgi:hypothetical protein
MLANIDPIAKIQQLYKDKRPVSYLTFMQVFNDLLEDPAALVVKDPTHALREKFRAACMAVRVGVIDTEGRGEERVREFREKILPLWESKLPPEEFRKYRQILGAPPKSADEEERSESAFRNAPAKTSALLKRLRLVGSDQGDEAAPPVPDGYGVAMKTAVEAPRFESVDQVCKAILDEKLIPEFLPRLARAELAWYRLGNVDVAVSLAHSDEKKYTILTAETGYAAVPGVQERLDGIAAEMGYVRQGRQAYARWDAECVYTLKVGPGKINVAVSAANVSAAENVVRHIQKAHMDLGELIERMRS